MAGQMVHVEIPAADSAKARAFWGGLFGWQFQAFEGSPSEYHMAQLSETQGVGIMAPEERLAGPRIYFDVDDVRAAVARVRELGGEPSEPMPVPGMGWFVTCKDDQGNDFGLWQSDSSAQ